jgi:sulfatase modifying factor 1
MSRLLHVCCLLIAMTTFARAEHRHALVIGNSQYPKAELVSPPHDVRAVGEALTKRGFVVTQLENLTGEKLRTAFDTFARSIPTRGTALVYFSGYALPNKKADDPTADNALLPIDGNGTSVQSVSNSQTGISSLMDRLVRDGGSALNVLIVDGCYAYPLRAPDAPRGLIEPAKVSNESRVIFAAPFGEVIEPAKDGLSPLAKRLIAASNSTQPLSEVLAQVSSTQVSTVADLAVLATPTSQAIAPLNAFKPGQNAGDEWINDIGMVFCWCPPGRFTIGSEPNEIGRQEDEVPSHVTFSHGYWVSKFEFTRGELKALTKQAGVYLATGDHKLQPLNKFRSDFPATLLTKLNELAPSGWQYALPTEAEWEYAARAGTTTAYSFGDDPAELAQHGNFADRMLREGDVVGEVGKSMKSKPFLGDRQTGLFTYAHKTWSDRFVTMAPVGSYLPNAWGLHDMHGNLAELTATPYHPQRTPPEKFDDRAGWVCKGGSWLSTASYCRSAFRGQFTFRSRENTTENYLGLRLVLRRKESP